jgi:hypothetical protein
LKPWNTERSTIELVIHRKIDVNPNPRRKRHLAETETIVEMELIAEMKNS